MRQIMCLLFSLICLSGIACDDSEQAVDDACYTLYLACDTMLPSVDDESYCVYADDPLDEFGRCTAMRRGALCQCLTPVCYELLYATAEDYDIGYEIMGLRCPRVL